MQYSSSESFESQFFPGVRVTLRKRSAERRAKFNLAIADLNQKLRDLQGQGEQAEAERCECGHRVSEHDLMANDCQAEGCTCRNARGPAFSKRTHVLVDLSNIDRDEVQPVRLRHFVKSIEGLDLDGKPADLDSLVSDGPDELLDEIDGRIKELLSLSEAERKNSESPTTSGAVADGAMSGTTAPSASEKAGTTAVTA